MNNANKVVGFIFISVVAFFLGSWVVAKSWDVSHLKDILNECQKDLPRSQKCELVAVVKK